jgi:ABC-type lipopolysaccharide export system ATPase subunit
LNVQFQIVAFNDVQTQSVNLEIKDAKKKKLKRLLSEIKFSPIPKKNGLKVLGMERRKSMQKY